MSIWQTHSWKNLILASNQAQSVFEVDGIFVEKRSIGLGKYGLFALGVSGKQKINEEKLIELCKKENSVFIQIESFQIPLSQPFPPRGKGVFIPPRPWGEGLGVREGYYKKFITPYTALIDVSKTEEEILASMKPKGRYNINLASKKGVEVFIAEKTEGNIKIFYDLMRQTTKRDGFSGNTLEYYKNFLEIISESSLIFTKFEDKILSAGIFIFDTEVSIYYYGASTSDKNYRNLMAPYLMQWFAIKQAKNIGSKYYDFLGVATPGEKNSSLAGVTDFKLKFTPDVRKVSESYIWVNKKFLYLIFKILKKIKSKI